jgi:hypothetical protein
MESIAQASIHPFEMATRFTKESILLFALGRIEKALGLSGDLSIYSEAPGLVSSTTYLRGVLAPPHSPDESGAAPFPIDKS